ncbi:hypothetical protein OG206_32015 [Streptomyces sp. NBC_01341]|uniref:hypothetical protein n=1 Tax=Streptomyces sp. NBC_01341 TaxID=2903831 RepID=UPI002E13925F|nr:hypothetical protein OG206_32015 [Streptomyces sp. NBC_01341]
MDASELGRGLFRILETGDRALAADVVHADFRNREAAVSPRACSIPGPAGVLRMVGWRPTGRAKRAAELVTAQAAEAAAQV